ncbi:MAG TPA: D-sedoheptulose 7-phosphate isomerase [Candidatus Polarisedimenticolia bacterium]|nr:D-sedoheptulose 7-phosphate isomerase [Candidatus Polarisedimenticolia bacterium]
MRSGTRGGRSRGGGGAPADFAAATARIEALYRAHAEAARSFFGPEGIAVVESIAAACIAALRTGRTLFFFGNGGSAADAQHLAAEFVNRFGPDRPALPAHALTTDTSILTSIGNDYDFSRIFARQVEALGRKGDVAIGLSTSGRSPNVLEALRTARAASLVTIGFTGGEGGGMKDLCRHLLLVPSRDTPRIQEVHILAGHIVCQLIEDALFPRP